MYFKINITIRKLSLEINGGKRRILNEVPQVIVGVHL